MKNNSQKQRKFSKTTPQQKFFFFVHHIINVKQSWAMVQFISSVADSYPSNSMLNEISSTASATKYSKSNFANSRPMVLIHECIML